MRILFICFFLVACTAVDPNEVKEVLPKGVTELDDSLEDLVEKAKEHYSNGLYSVAISEFEKLVLNFPNSAYEEFAEIKIADANFELGLFSEASIKYEGFITKHPGSKYVEYASFRRAFSAYTASPAPGRNQSNTELALEIMNDFITTYPQSTYITEARQLRADCYQRLYEHDLKIIEYLEKSAPDAYDVRVKEIKKKFANKVNF